MISFTMLSLPPETLRRMRSHLASEETRGRRWESVGAVCVAALIAVAAGVIAVLAR